MIKASFKSSGSHYYLSDGSPVDCRDVREARKKGAFPSVTTILKILDKPFLVNWKILQVMMHSETKPRPESLDIESWIQSCIEDFEKSSLETMQLGSSYHKALEDWISSKGNVPYSMIEPETIKQAKSLLISKGLDFNKEIISEKSKTNIQLGYAGTVDLIAYFGNDQRIVDFKTKATKENEKIVTYDDYWFQLAAYSLLFGVDKCSLLYMSTTESGRVVWVDFEEEKLSKFKASWKALVQFYLQYKGFILPGGDK